MLINFKKLSKALVETHNRVEYDLACGAVPLEKMAWELGRRNATMLAYKWLHTNSEEDEVESEDYMKFLTESERAAGKIAFDVSKDMKSPFEEKLLALGELIEYKRATSNLLDLKKNYEAQEDKE